jgi:hypothetical protein
MLIPPPEHTHAHDPPFYHPHTHHHIHCRYDLEGFHDDVEAFMEDLKDVAQGVGGDGLSLSLAQSLEFLRTMQ